MSMSIRMRSIAPYICIARRDRELSAARVPMREVAAGCSGGHLPVPPDVRGADPLGPAGAGRAYPLPLCRRYLLERARPLV